MCAGEDIWCNGHWKGVSGGRGQAMCAECRSKSWHHAVSCELGTEQISLL